MLEDLSILPASPDKWNDLYSVMEDCSEGRKCWCAYWYLSNKAYRDGYGHKNQSTLRELVEDGREPGLIAYHNDQPIAWLGVGPREWYDRLERNKGLARLSGDEFERGQLWSMTCIIVKKGYRKKGVMRPLIASAIEFARQNGAVMLEAYPIDATRKMMVWDLFLGTKAAYDEAGFYEVERRLPTRPIMRLELN